MTHAELVERAKKWLERSRRCMVVASEVGSQSLEIPDALGWQVNGTSWLIECKTSRSDFFRDQHKPARRIPDFLGIGNYRYYMTPPGLVASDELPNGWGLLEVHPRQVRTKHKAEYHGDSGIAERERCMLVATIRAEYRRIWERYQ